MGNAKGATEKSDASAKTEVTSTPKKDKEGDVSNNLIENQWNKVKTNIDNLREDATINKPNSLAHLDQYFAQSDVPQVSIS